MMEKNTSQVVVECRTLIWVDLEAQDKKDNNSSITKTKGMAMIKTIIKKNIIQHKQKQMQDIPKKNMCHQWKHLLL